MIAKLHLRVGQKHPYQRVIGLFQGSFDIYFETSVSGEWISSFMMDQSSMIANQTIVQEDRNP